MNQFSTITSKTSKCLKNLAASPRRTNILKNSLIDLCETWLRVKLPRVQQSSVIGYKSDEPFFYNHIKHKEISNKSDRSSGRANFCKNTLIDLYET